jgi:hypothetical protein
VLGIHSATTDFALCTNPSKNTTPFNVPFFGCQKNKWDLQTHKIFSNLHASCRIHLCGLIFPLAPQFVPEIEQQGRVLRWILVGFLRVGFRHVCLFFLIASKGKLDDEA